MILALICWLKTLNVTQLFHGAVGSDTVTGETEESSELYLKWKYVTDHIGTMP